MKNKIKKLFCRHNNKEVYFVGVRQKGDKLVRVIFSECKECGKRLVYEKPKVEYTGNSKRQIQTYYGGTNPND